MHIVRQEWKHARKQRDEPGLIVDVVDVVDDDQESIRHRLDHLEDECFGNERSVFGRFISKWRIRVQPEEWKVRSDGRREVSKERCEVAIRCIDSVPGDESTRLGCFVCREDRFPKSSSSSDYGRRAGVEAFLEARVEALAEEMDPELWSLNLLDDKLLRVSHSVTLQIPTLIVEDPTPRDLRNS